MQLVLDNPKKLINFTDKRIVDRLKEFLPINLRKLGPKFLIYLINSPKSMSILHKRSLYSVVLPSRFIQSHFDGLYKLKEDGIDQLLELKIISRSNYRRATDNASGLCREYTINPEILLEIMLYAHSLDQCLKVEGNMKNPVTIPEAGTLPYTPSAVDINPSSPLYPVMSHLFQDVISIKDIETYCVNRYKELLSKKKKLLIKNPKRYNSEVASIASDYYKYVALLMRGMTDDTGVFKYQKKFIVTSTGRLCEIAGGLQGLSRGCKAYMYGKIPNINNYDIRACQLALLSHIAKKIDIDTSWIDNYISNDRNKKDYARVVGISVDAWKKTILSLVFGGQDSRFGSPYKTILTDKSGNRKLANQAFDQWKEVTEGLRSICKQWLTRIRKYAKNCARDNIIENAVGIQINLKDRSVTRKFLSSFFLQGLESRVISELILFPTKTYKVISPEYDGIVVEGTIDEEVWAEVLKRAGLSGSRLVLENKPFN